MTKTPLKNQTAKSFMVLRCLEVTSSLCLGALQISGLLFTGLDFCCSNA